MSSLNEPLGLKRVQDPDPETVTATRNRANKLFGLSVPPSKYELDFYASEGRTPPTD